MALKSPDSCVEEFDAEDEAILLGQYVILLFSGVKVRTLAATQSTLWFKFTLCFSLSPPEPRVPADGGVREDYEQVLEQSVLQCLAFNEYSVGGKKTSKTHLTSVLLKSVLWAIKYSSEKSDPQLVCPHLDTMWHSLTLPKDRDHTEDLCGQEKTVV